MGTTAKTVNSAAISRRASGKRSDTGNQPPIDRPNDLSRAPNAAPGNPLLGKDPGGYFSSARKGGRGGAQPHPYPHDPGNFLIFPGTLSPMPAAMHRRQSRVERLTKIPPTVRSTWLASTALPFFPQGLPAPPPRSHQERWRDHRPANAVKTRRSASTPTASLTPITIPFGSLISIGRSPPIAKPGAAAANRPFAISTPQNHRPRRRSQSLPKATAAAR